MYLPLPGRKMHAQAWGCAHVSVSISRQGLDALQVCRNHARCYKCGKHRDSCKILPFKARGQEKGKVACLKCRPAFIAVYMAALAAGAAAGHFVPGMLVVALGMGAILTSSGGQHRVMRAPVSSAHRRQLAASRRPEIELSNMRKGNGHSTVGNMQEHHQQQCA